MTNKSIRLVARSSIKSSYNRKYLKY